MKKITQHRQAGFTLIELMIALALGLVIAAAAIMLFLTGQKSYSLQQGAADLQDNANFGLNYIVKDIRLSNLNTLSSEMNDETAGGGVVFTSSVNGKKESGVVVASNLPKNLTGATVAAGLLSKGNDGLSNVNTEKSDQLVIQYKPQYIRVDYNKPPTPADPDDDEWFGGFDCEGNEIKFPIKTGGADTPLRIYVQRYFLRKDDNKASNEPQDALTLACDAGWYNETGNPDKVENYGDDGQIIMKRVDYFHVMFGVQDNANFRYISTKDYMALTAPRPRILSLQLGILARSSQPVGNDSMIKNNQKFQVLDKEVILKAPIAGSSKYVRQAVSQTIALRNTFGERGQ